ncbi:TetR/AcrR family transcriptional regulator [Dictyobacter arantiisoli]|uniref:TetR family transcriptional regulator n=1 Tax=Dictyobacter arantiisoli TaxID=2014874 RepID=A0A5A5TCM5_9CHLR|nr:TetR/AcrR family transcriptional regulator [Dictyobacter arantiisoli]GCF08783.1 TetR family transcriptional regulator [Dictyobacter arantiisoli]
MDTPQPRSLKEKQRQERELLILQVAEDVLLEKGYRDTSMDEIAARVGIAKGTLYLHFAKKEDLMLAFFEREMVGILTCLKKIYATHQSVQSRLEKFVKTIYSDPKERRGHLMYIFINSDDFTMTVKHQAQPIFAEIVQEVSALLDEGKANGEFDTLIPTPLMTTSFFSLLSPRTYRSLIERGYDPKEIMRYSLGIYFRGIGGQFSFATEQQS